jgi:potassium efflux system protein
LTEQEAFEIGLNAHICHVGGAITSQMNQWNLSRSFTGGGDFKRKQAPLHARGRIGLRSFRRLLLIPPGLVLVAFAATFFFLPAALSQGAEQETTKPPKAPAPPSSAAIPVAEVATRATEASNLLRALNTQLAPSPEIETIRKGLPEVGKDMLLELHWTRTILAAQPSLETIQTQQNLWQRRQLHLSKWLNLLTQRATQLQEALNRLADLEKTWSQTLEAAQASKAPGPTLQEIKTVLTAVEGAQTPLQAQRTDLIDLQSRVAQQVALCGTVLGEIAQAEGKAVGGLLARGSPPLWSPVLWAIALAEGPARVRQIAADHWTEIEQYVGDPLKGMALFVGLLVVLVLLWWAARRQVRRWQAAGAGSPATKVFERPYAAALIVSLLIASSPYVPAPPIVNDLFELLALAPIIRLMRPMADPRVVPGLYALVLLFAVDTVRHVFAGAPFLEQTTIVLESLAGMALLGWSLAFGTLRRSQAQPTGPSRLRIFRIGAVLALFALAGGLVAGVLGYMRLARLLISGTVVGGALALILSAFVLLLTGVAAFALRVWPLRLLRMVQHHRAMLERRTHRVLVWLAVFDWLYRWLDYVGLLQPALSFGEAVFAVRLKRGSISISLGDIVAFFLTMWVAFLLSAFIRFALEEDVYPKKGISRGLSYATSRLLHYVILALGFLVGLGVLGVDLTKVTVLAGAFGVGIGFGLQDVVNNFVCGMILLFERPIHVGDMIEIGDLLGEVRRIGIRASTVHTRQGADIVVPNSQFITANVTNWTLSDQLRRIQLPIGVNYSAPPKKVIEVLEAVARAHPRVLQNPPPQAIFVGFGDSSINFELRAWTDEFQQWRLILSELAVAVYDAVHEAGMSFPFPQREVRLLRDPEVDDSASPQPAEVGEAAASEEPGRRPPSGEDEGGQS